MPSSQLFTLGLSHHNNLDIHLSLPSGSIMLLSQHAAEIAIYHNSSVSSGCQYSVAQILDALRQMHTQDASYGNLIYMQHHREFYEMGRLTWGAGSIMRPLRLAALASFRARAWATDAGWSVAAFLSSLAWSDLSSPASMSCQHPTNRPLNFSGVECCL